MTVIELIGRLSRMPADSLVFVDDYGVERELRIVFSRSTNPEVVSVILSPGDDDA